MSNGSPGPRGSSQAARRVLWVIEEDEVLRVELLRGVVAALAWIETRDVIDLYEEVAEVVIRRLPEALRIEARRRLESDESIRVLLDAVFLDATPVLVGGWRGDAQILVEVDAVHKRRARPPWFTGSTETQPSTTWMLAATFSRHAIV